MTRRTDDPAPSTLRNRRWRERQKQARRAGAPSPPQQSRPIPGRSAPDVAALLALALAAPDLPGAACKGDSALHDPQFDGEAAVDAAARHELAADTCRACPALAPCTAWVSELPKKSRPGGVVAGQTPNTRKGHDHEQHPA